MHLAKTQQEVVKKIITALPDGAIEYK